MVLGLLGVLFQQGDVKTLVEAERAFSRASAKSGMKASFLEYFSDRGVMFAPTPEKAAVVLKTVADDPKPKQILTWEPYRAEVAFSGDFGYTTGPYVVTDRETKKATRHGHYFSVWGKEDGKWRVLVDFGVGHPPALETKREYVNLPRPNAPVQTPLGDKELLAIEANWSRMKDWIGDFVTDWTRLHLEGQAPQFGPAAIRAISFLLPAQDAKWTVLGSGMASSGDLGYTYGSYEADPKKSSGYWLRMWRRDADSSWKIAVMVLKPNLEL